MPNEQTTDFRSAWLPKDPMKRYLNMMTAIRNLCAAISDSEYSEYCKSHLKKSEKNGDKEVPVYVNPEAAYAFDNPKKRMLVNLYRKYWRKCACAAGYPVGAPYNLGLVPPTVPEFKAMLYYENQQQRA